VGKPGLQTFGILLILAGSLLLHSCIRGSIYPATFSTEGITQPPIIRVALTRDTEHRHPSVPIAISGAYVVLEGERVSRTEQALSGTITRTPSGTLSLDGTDLGVREITFDPAVDGDLALFGRRYRGAAYIYSDPAGTGIVACNDVDLESYVRGVLTAEMPMSYPKASLHAQSVAARTYALYEIKSRTLRDRHGFDVFDDTRSQMYRGMAAETDTSDQIVRDTRGVVLTFKGRIFKTYFSNTCGGGTDSAHDVFGDPDLPPLAGAPCNYCTGSRFYKWGPVILSMESAEKKLFPDDPSAQIRAVRVARRTDEDRLVELEIILAGDRSETMDANIVRLTLNEGVSIQSDQRIRSTRMSLEVTDKNLRMFGNGWGHGVGMCQEGARGMARANHSGEAILEFYYPQAKLHQIY
jgi:stage II sporulation protein D